MYIAAQHRIMHFTSRRPQAPHAPQRLLQDTQILLRRRRTCPSHAKLPWLLRASETLAVAVAVSFTAGFLLVGCFFLAVAGLLAFWLPVRCAAHLGWGKGREGRQNHGSQRKGRGGECALASCVSASGCGGGGGGEGGCSPIPVGGFV